MALSVVRSMGARERVLSPQALEDFEQELVDQYALAAAAMGLTDAYVSGERRVLFEFVGFLGRPIWTAECGDVDRFLVVQRKDKGLARSTVQTKAWTIGRFFDFLISRYQAEIHRSTGYVVAQPVDEFNRPAKPDVAAVRVPPTDDEIEHLFAMWRESLPEARKYLPAARDYVAASLWRRVGLRITESVMLDVRDWRPDVGEVGKLHVRYGKGSRGRGPKTRLVPTFNGVDGLLHWWFTDVRHQFGPDWSQPDAPLLPSERRDPDTGWCTRAGDDALRSGLAGAVRRWLPAWQGRLTPHVLRHYCASHLYARGVDLHAVQELLGHNWLSTTTRYVHVHNDQIERAWAKANDRITARLERRKG